MRDIADERQGGDGPVSNRVRLIPGDCIRAMRLMAHLGIQVDSIVTDPPYHLTSIVKRFAKATPEKESFAVGKSYSGYMSRGFMGKKWDGGDVAFDSETWRAAFHVLKPGGHLLAFGGTRGWHRLACAVEDAGFEIRDTVAWLFGSGFPKSHDVSKAIDKAAGAVRKVVGHSAWDSRKPNGSAGVHSVGLTDAPGGGDITAPATPEAEQWQGWGTALKPAFEPIILARKPCSEKSVAANVLRHGTGAINVDGCRVGTADGLNGGSYGNTSRDRDEFFTGKKPGGVFVQPEGRWPANVCHDGSEEVEAAFGAFGDKSSARASGNPNNPKRGEGGIGGNVFGRGDGQETIDHRDSGTAARFFYSAKAGPLDRFGSKHPTVKPVDLMRWLVRLITPLGGLVLDPFAGSGTTGVAAIAEGFRAVLIEAEPEYQADIRERLAWLSGEGGHSASVRQRHRDPPKSHGPLFEEAAE